MVLKKNQAVSKRTNFFLLVTLLFLVSILLTSAKITGISKPTGTSSANFTGTIKLIEGNLHLSYSSSKEDLKLECSFESEEKSYSLSLTSQDRLGILIIVEGKNISYAVEFLRQEHEWKPLEKRTNKNEYKSRAKLFQKPGWEILVVEKAGQLAA
ncbi:hypothetical protein KGY79_05960 [Candidatus Bipolaricaulota bacterium]|nr:hypothetical protein [Candidatus Bipolaricaulota bacterium]